MPYDLAEDGDYLYLRLSGCLSAADLVGLGNAIEELEARLEAAPDRITDTTAVVAFDVTFEMVRGLAERRKSLVFPNPFKSAFVLDKQIEQGMVRMFQALNNHPQITFNIFNSRAAAEDWLRSWSSGTGILP